ncbi:MAG: histidine kinase [Solirubrobacterales bacterium]
MRSLLKRLQAVDPRIEDAALAAAVMTGGAIEFAVYFEGGTGTAVAALVGVAGIGTLYWRRSRPLLCGYALAIALVAAGLGAPDFNNRVAAPFVALMIMLYSVGRHATLGRGVPVVVFTLASSAATGLIGGWFDNPAQALWLLVLGWGPFLAGRGVRHRAELQRTLRERTAELERDRERQAELAVFGERARIAEELQVVVANGVSAMVVQAEAVPRLVGAADNVRAEGALTLIEETGRDAMGEMRRLLGVLRRDGEGPSLAPLPTLEGVERLDGTDREDGLAVSVTIEGEPVKLSPGADLAAYRVLEQALDSAGDAGASAASVVVGFDGNEVRLVIVDDRDAASVDPTGLVAMRDRVGLYGGRVHAEVTDAHGLRVIARVPLGSSA